MSINEGLNFSKGLEDNFDKKPLNDFLNEMKKIEKDVDPRFKDSFNLYKKEISGLLSDNISVAESNVVQKEIAKQNTRIQMAFETDSSKLNQAYSKIFS